MKKVVRYVDENTLEIMEKVVDDNTVATIEADETFKLLKDTLGCKPEEFSKKYNAYKEAERAFNEVYEPFKANLIKLHEDHPNIPKSVIIGSTKVTYVSPSIRTSVDSKKLKEEEPTIAEKYAKTTNVKASIRLEKTIDLGGIL